MKINVNVQPFDRKLELEANGEFQLSWQGWIADYNDPMTFLDLLLSDSPFNTGGYSNAEYDELINQALEESDFARRMQLMMDAEELLSRKTRARADVLRGRGPPGPAHDHELRRPPVRSRSRRPVVEARGLERRRTRTPCEARARAVPETGPPLPDEYHLGGGLVDDRYVARRIVYMFITLFIIISITFFISKLLPGTPFADDKLTPQTRAQLFEKYGLDEPIYVQYAKYMANVAQGDLGNSFYFESRPVTQMILERAPVSAFIGIQAVIFGLVVGLVLGIVSALRHNTYWDTLAVVIAVLGVSVPTFVLGPILQYVFGVRLGWFPIAFFESYIYSVLPSLALSVFVISTVARFVRSEMLEVLGQDYITLAKAKGLSGLAVIIRTLCATPSYRSSPSWHR